MQERNALQSVLVFLKSLNNIHVTMNGFVVVDPIEERRKRQQRKLSHEQPKTSQFSLEGEVTRGDKTPFAIDGIDFQVSSSCWVVGRIELGSVAKVRGPIRGDGAKIATSIVIVRTPYSN
jgi:hypothetical protein